MRNARTLTTNRKAIITFLLIAFGGVLLQIVSGAPYPTIPPVFFLLLVPAALIAFGRWRWTIILSLLSGLFLTLGLFSSGAYHRLIHVISIGDTIGLWIQSIALFAVIFYSLLELIASTRFARYER